MNRVVHFRCRLSWISIVIENLLTIRRATEKEILRINTHLEKYPAGKDETSALVQLEI